MDSLPLRPIVVFYDCCVPWKQFRAIVPPVALFARHIFVGDRFSEKVFRNDTLLFEEVVKETRKKYARAICSLLVTVDGGFAREVGHLPGYGDVTKVICLSIGPEGTQDKNWEAAVQFASQLAWVYGKIRERASCRRENEENFRQACREILRECFGKD